MTTLSERRVLTSNRVYSAAIFAIGMAVPHLYIGLQAHWPPQLMSAHVLLVVLLLFAGARIEHSEKAAAEAARRRRPAARKRKKKAAAVAAQTQRGGVDTLVWLDKSLHDDER